MPPQKRVRRHNRGDLAQGGAPETLSTRRPPAPLIIREPQPSAAQPGPQDSMLFHQIRDVWLVRYVATTAVLAVVN
jgi:hypothetical protein